MSRHGPTDGICSGAQCGNWLVALSPVVKRADSLFAVTSSGSATADFPNVSKVASFGFTSGPCSCLDFRRANPPRDVDQRHSTVPYFAPCCLP